MLGQAEPTVVGIAPSPPSIRFSALSLENRQHSCHMNALLFRILAKLWAFNFGHPCPSLVKGEVLSPEKIRAITGGIAAPTFAPHYPARFSCCEFDSPTYRKNKIRPRFHGGELIKSLIYKY